MTVVQKIYTKQFLMKKKAEREKNLTNSLITK